MTLSILLHYVLRPTRHIIADNFLLRPHSYSFGCTASSSRLEIERRTFPEIERRAFRISTIFTHTTPATTKTPKATTSPVFWQCDSRITSQNVLRGELTPFSSRILLHIVVESYYGCGGTTLPCLYGPVHTVLHCTCMNAAGT